jgi:hypothetical protein
MRRTFTCGAGRPVAAPDEDRDEDGAGDAGEGGNTSAQYVRVMISNPRRHRPVTPILGYSWAIGANR